LSRSTAINRQGMIMGLNQSLMSGANISAPLISGALIGHRLFVSGRWQWLRSRQSAWRWPANSSTRRGRAS
jgi:MFS family permease